MRKNIEISDEKINEFLEQFYSYFESGYAFEEFLKVYLEKIGLDEVVVTQRSSDGGIDLEAVRYGVGGFAGADAVDYFVQAKRNKPGTTIPIEKVRALRGVMPSGSKGIFITTASYSKKTEEFVDADPSRPIILIDGKSLVESCIDNEIGFVFTPVFSKNAMDEENKYVVKEAEIKQLEREHITESVYCNEYRYCSLSWFYSGIGYELVLNDIAIVDEELIKKAASLIGYESDNDFANGLADVIENSSGGEDKFIASLVLAKEIARTLGGRAVIIFD